VAASSRTNEKPVPLLGHEVLLRWRDLRARVLLAAGPVLNLPPSLPASFQRHKGVNSSRRAVKNANVLGRGIAVRIPRTP
jgi:hypothetical protein